MFVCLEPKDDSTGNGAGNVVTGRRWCHVAMTIENNQGNDGRVTLLLNGKQVAQGLAPAPVRGEEENLQKDCALFILPNVEVSEYCFDLFFVASAYWDWYTCLRLQYCY